MVVDGLGDAGRRLYEDVIGKYDLEEHELALLLEACRTVDMCERLQVIIDESGVMTVTGQGLPKVNPAVVELRYQRIALARIISALRLPDEDEGLNRPQWRQGTRRPYSLKAVDQ